MCEGDTRLFNVVFVDVGSYQMQRSWKRSLLHLKFLYWLLIGIVVLDSRA